MPLTRRPRAASSVPNRWLIAAGGVTVQLGLGTVYSWSVYRRPLSEQYGWSIPEVTLTFSILIVTAGIMAFVGGLWLSRAGPRRVAVAAGFLYGAGVGLTSLSGGSLAFLYLTYGLMGGIGLGLGYIVPIATLVKWFPDRRGFIVGLAVTGVAGGSLVASPIAARLVEAIGVLDTFAVVGVAYLVIIVGGAALLRDPPPDYWPSAQRLDDAHAKRAISTFSLREALGTWQWYALWAIFFLNVTAGVGFVSEGAPMAQDLVDVSAVAAASLFGTAFIGDAIGRFAWPWLSDAVGRQPVLTTIFLVQGALFIGLSVTGSPALFAMLGALILFTYGGSSGTMAATTADLFGSRNVGSIYGLMLTAWGFGGVCGPLLISALRESTGSYTSALRIVAVIMLLSAFLPLLLRRPRGSPGAPALSTQNSVSAQSRTSATSEKAPPPST